MNIEEKIHIAEMEKFLERYELQHFHVDVWERIITLVIAALGLIAALAWDKALHHVFEKISGHAGSIPEELTYAVTITVFAALVSVRLGRLATSRQQKLHRAHEVQSADQDSASK